MTTNLAFDATLVDLTIRAIGSIASIYSYQQLKGYTNADMSTAMTQVANNLSGNSTVAPQGLVYLGSGGLSNTVTAWIAGNSSTNGIFANAVYARNAQ